MLFTLPKGLHYPITITKLLVEPGAEIELGTKLFTYTYTTIVSQIDGEGGRRNVRVEYPANFESPVEGRLIHWTIKEQTPVARFGKPVAEIEQECAHDVVFEGLCTLCGRDMSTAVLYRKPIIARATGAGAAELLLETARQQQQQQQQQQQDDDAVEAGQEEEEDEALQLQREWQRRLAQVADDEAEEEAAEAEAKTRHITYVHGKRHALRVSRAEARRTEEEAKLRLIRRKKLSLVVDLDQTIIQATVDPTVGEWQADPDNPNYDAVRDVQRFQLPEDAPGYTPEAAEKHRRRHAWLKSKNLGRSARAGRARGRAKSAVYDDDSDDEWKNAFLPHNGCWYYIKPRPGLREFLERASDMFEYHIYTMGTRSYAKAVARIVDPTRKYFGNRILSRDESGSLTIKNLRRIFPVDTKMVVVIDDRGDVWKWAKNLVKVAPFDFFVGIGDINSSYLPKKPVLEKVDKVSGAVTTAQGQQNTSGDDKEKPDGTADTSDQTAGAGGGSEETPSAATLVQIVTMGGGESPDLLQKQAEKRDEAIQHQVQERPLLQQQKALDDGEDVAMTDADAEADGPSSGSPAADDEAMSLGETDPTSTSSTSSVTTSSGVRSRQRLLKDDDTELVRIYQLLQQIHHEFYHVFDLNRKRMLETAGANSGADSGLDARTAADVDAMISSTTVAAASTPASSASTTKTTTTQIPVPTPTIPPRLIPDVKDVMHRLKVMVLEPVRLVFTSILPLGTDIENADLSVWARGFGAEVQTQINPKTTTHVIAGEPRTAKVKEALMWPRRIKIVRLAWLVDSLTRWEMLPERDYAVAIDPRDRRNARRARKAHVTVSQVEAALAGTEEVEGLSEADVQAWREEDERLGMESEATDDEGYEYAADSEDEDLNWWVAKVDDGSNDDDVQDEESHILREVRYTREAAMRGADDPMGYGDSPIDEELAEFLGDDVDLSDDGSTSSAELAALVKKKRKRGDGETENGGSDDEDVDGRGEGKRVRGSAAAGKGTDPHAVLDSLPGVPPLSDSYAAAAAAAAAQQPAAAQRPGPHSPGLTPPAHTNLPTRPARASAMALAAATDPPRTLDPLRGSHLEGVDYNAQSPQASPSASAAHDPAYTAADAYDSANFGRGGRAQLAGTVQPAAELAAEGDDDALEREMLAAFEEGDFGAPAEEAHAQGVEQGVDADEVPPAQALQVGDVGGLTEREKRAQRQGRLGTWGGEGNGPFGVGEPRTEEGDEAYSR